jgi:hypothetical protein
MKQHLVLIPFYSVGRMIEIDFKAIKKSLNDKI